MITPAADDKATAREDAKRLQCMEVWGGNRFVSTTLAMPGLDVFIYSLPHDGAQSVGGGDVHYVSSCAAGVISRLMVADVAGHGADVADIARRLRKPKQPQRNHHQQTGIVKALNREFAALAQSGRFATAVAFSYEGPSERVLVCNAGHPTPFIYRARSRSWEPLAEQDTAAAARTSDNIPLGVIETIEYEQFGSKMQTGDVVLCYTDALTEARRADGTMLQTEGALELVRSLDVSRADQIIPSLLAALRGRAGAGGCTTDDDLTLLVFRANGSRPRVPLSAHVTAPIRVICSLVKAIIPSRGDVSPSARPA
jgi:serine phosphatase RsbU (regulator of sigma subunit)